MSATPHQQSTPYTHPSNGIEGMGVSPPPSTCSVSVVSTVCTPSSSHISRLIDQYEAHRPAVTPGRSMSTSSNIGSIPISGGLISPGDRRASAPPISTVIPNGSPPPLTLNSNRNHPIVNTSSPMALPKTIPPPLPTHTKQRSSVGVISLLSPPSPSLHTPGGSRKKRTGFDDTNVEPVPRASPRAAGNFSFFGARSSPRSPKATDSSSSSVSSHIAAVRHKLQSFRTLPMNLPSGATLGMSAALFGDDSKSNELAMSSPVGSAASSAGPVSSTRSPSPPNPTGALSPTHFSYSEKRAIWVQREREEMLAKVNLKKVLRKINDSRLIVRQSRWGSQAAQSASQTASPPNTNTINSEQMKQPNSAKSEPRSSIGNGSVTGRPSMNIIASPQHVSPLPIPSPPFATRAASQPPPIPPQSPNDVASHLAGSVSPVLNGVSLPSPQFPSITITELSAAASNLNLTGRLGRLEFARDCAFHLSKMEHHACTFTSAPQLMWALKALTLTEDDAARVVDSTHANHKPAANTSTNGTDPSTYSSHPASHPAPFSPSLAQLTRSELFRSKRAAVEAIIAEQGFAPPVVQYLRAHAIANATPASANTTRGNVDGAVRPTESVTAHTVSGHMKTLSEPAQLAVVVPPPEGVPPPVPAFPHALQTTHKPSQSVAPSVRRGVRIPVGGGGDSVSSSRSNSVTTELETEWSRRRIPKVRLKTVAQRVDMKLKEEKEDLEERRRGIVQKMLALNIWENEATNTPTPSATANSNSCKPSVDDVLTSLSSNRFDLLRFTFELTELSEMEFRGIRFTSCAQAMSALKILYDPLTSKEIATLCETKKIPNHVRAYLESRRMEITRARTEQVDGTNATRTGRNASRPALALPISPTASPLHHRSISLLELVDVLDSGNLLSTPAKISAESLSWLLTDVGLELSEVSIDDLISMQQDATLVKAFQSPQQVILALATLYTDHDESDIIDICKREGMNEQIRTYLIESQRHSTTLAAGIEANLQHMASSNILGGGKRSRVERVQQHKVMRGKVVQFELQLDDELDLVEEEADESLDRRQSQSRNVPTSQSYPLHHSDRAILRARDRSIHPLPTITQADLCRALNTSDLLSLSAPLDERALEQILFEMGIDLLEDTLELDLDDMKLFEQRRFKFETPKQLLTAMQLLNIECASLDEFRASCARVHLSVDIVEFLVESSRACAASRLLSYGSSHHSSSAKYALLEYEVRHMDFEEMDAICDESEEVRIEFGSPTTNVARGIPRYAQFETQMMTDDDHLAAANGLVGAESDGGVSVIDLAARLQSTSLLVPSADAAHLSVSSLSQMVTRLELPLGSLDQNLLFDDMTAMEVQGGLKFKNPRALIQALVDLQDESLQDDNLFYQQIESAHVSPSITAFLLQLHRSPARAAKQAVVRSRRRPVAGGIIRSFIVEEANPIGDEPLEEEIVATIASHSLAKLLKQYHTLDEGGAPFDVSELSSELLRTDVEQLPEFCIESDLNAFATHGIKFANARAVVHILDLLHRDEDPSSDEFAIDLPIASPDVRAKHIEFLLQHRALHMQHLGAELKIQPFPTTRPRNRGGMPITINHTMEESDLTLGEESADHQPVEDGAAQHVRVARALSTILQSAHIDLDDATSDGVLHACVELQFHLDDGNLADAELLVEESRKTGVRGDLRQFIMSLQLVDEAAALDGASSPRSIAQLPPVYAEFVQTRSDRSAQIHAAMVHRRAVKTKQPNTIITIDQLEATFDGVEWADDAVGSSRRVGGDIRSFCSELSLDLDSVTLDEVRVLRDLSATHRLRGPKQVVELFKLMQYDCAGQLSKDQLLNELDRIDATAAATRSERNTPCERQQLVRLLFDAEEQLSSALVDSLLPPVSSTSPSSPTASPDPPPFPKHLIKTHTLDDARSPPVPAYPYGDVKPVTKAHDNKEELSPEKQYDTLVEYINQLGLAKSP